MVNQYYSIPFQPLHLILLCYAPLRLYIQTLRKGRHTEGTKENQRDDSGDETPLGWRNRPHSDVSPCFSSLHGERQQRRRLENPILATATATFTVTISLLRWRLSLSSSLFNDLEAQAAYQSEPLEHLTNLDAPNIDEVYLVGEDLPATIAEKPTSAEKPPSAPSVRQENEEDSDFDDTFLDYMD